MNPAHLIAFTRPQRRAARRLADLVHKGQGNSPEARQLALKITHPPKRRKTA